MDATEIRYIREGVAAPYVSCEPSDSIEEIFPEKYDGGEAPKKEKMEQA